MSTLKQGAATKQRQQEQNNNYLTKPKTEIVVWYCTCAVSKHFRWEGDSPRLNWKFRNPKVANRIKEIVGRRISTALLRYTNFTIEQHCTTAVVTNKTQYFTTAGQRVIVNSARTFYIAPRQAKFIYWLYLIRAFEQNASTNVDIL